MDGLDGWMETEPQPLDWAVPALPPIRVVLAVQCSNYGKYPGT